MSSEVLLCQICGSSNAQSHFGAITCRACAAFFRRYVVAKKPTVLCKCNKKTVSRYPCRLCRLKKCESIGMKISLVQPSRDLNLSPKKNQKNADGNLLFMDYSVERPIALRTIMKLENMNMNYSILCDDRNIVGATMSTMNMVNMYELSCFSMDDFQMMSNMYERTFSEISAIGAVEKNILFSNFFAKWVVLECCFQKAKIYDSWTFSTPFGHLVLPIECFYTRSKTGEVLAESDAVKIFTPYWTYFTNILVPYFSEKKLHDFEYMALLVLSFFDPGHSNLSEECVDLCNKLKPMYLRELRAYYTEMNFEDSDARFFDILNILRLVEKGEVKIIEEMEMCCAFDVMVNEDYRRLLMTHKY